MGFRRGTFKRRIWLFSGIIHFLYLRGENCLKNGHFYKQQWPCLKRPLIWTGSVFPLLIFSRFQSASVNFNQFHSVWLSQKRKNLLATGRWGKQHVSLCDKDFAELSGELSGAICLKYLVLLVNDLNLFRQFFRAVHMFLLALWVLFWLLILYAIHLNHATFSQLLCTILFPRCFILPKSWGCSAQFLWNAL